MFSESYSEKKLKVNLKLAINRLKLVEKKKTETALRSRKEIADYIKMNKVERAKIRVEHIIREDYLVEALEIIEMQCDLILARIALLNNKSKTVHVSIHEAVESILWAYPQISGDCLELKVVVDQLAKKFGKQYVNEVMNKDGHENPHVNKKLVSRLDPSAPKAYIIETYLEAIAQAYEVDYTADQAVMAAHQRQKDIRSEDLLHLDDNGGNMFMPAIPNTQPSAPAPKHQGGNGGGGGGSFAYPEPQQSMNFNQPGFTQPPQQFAPPQQPAPKPAGSGSNFSSMSTPLSGDIYNAGGNVLSGEVYQQPSSNVNNQIPPNEKAKAAEQPYTGQNASTSIDGPPSYNDYNTHQRTSTNEEEEFDFQLPEIPTGFKKDDDDNNAGGTGGGDDFDDLEARFANLKK